MAIIDKVKVATVTYTVALPYAECTTAAATAAKTVTMTDVTLAAGTSIRVKFTNSNTAANPTLSVNGGTAISIKAYGTTAPTVYWKAGTVVELTYDGTNFVISNYGAMSETSRSPGAGTASLSGSNVTLSTTNNGIYVTATGSGSVSTGTGYITSGSTSSNSANTTKYITAVTVPKDQAFSVTTTADTALDDTSTLTVTNNAYRKSTIWNQPNGCGIIDNIAGTSLESITSAYIYNRAYRKAYISNHANAQSSVDNVVGGYTHINNNAGTSLDSSSSVYITNNAYRKAQISNAVNGCAIITTIAGTSLDSDYTAFVYNSAYRKASISNAVNAYTAVSNTAGTALDSSYAAYITNGAYRWTYLNNAANAKSNIDNAVNGTISINNNAGTALDSNYSITLTNNAYRKIYVTNAANAVLMGTNSTGGTVNLTNAEGTSQESTSSIAITNQNYRRAQINNAAGTSLESGYSALIYNYAYRKSYVVNYANASLSSDNYGSANIYNSDTGNATISNKGTTTVSSYSTTTGNLTVNAYNSSSTAENNKSVVSNGKWVQNNVSSAGTYYGRTTVSTESRTFTANGTYSPTSGKLISSVTVNVPSPSAAVLKNVTTSTSSGLPIVQTAGTVATNLRLTDIIVPVNTVLPSVTLDPDGWSPSAGDQPSNISSIHFKEYAWDDGEDTYSVYGSISNIYSDTPQAAYMDTEPSIYIAAGDTSPLNRFDGTVYLGNPQSSASSVISTVTHAGYGTIAALSNYGTITSLTVTGPNVSSFANIGTLTLGNYSHIGNLNMSGGTYASISNLYGTGNATVASGYSLSGFGVNGILTSMSISGTVAAVNLNAGGTISSINGSASTAQNASVNSVTGMVNGGSTTTLRKATVSSLLSSSLLGPMWAIGYNTSVKYGRFTVSSSATYWPLMTNPTSQTAAIGAFRTGGTTVYGGVGSTISAGGRGSSGIKIETTAKSSASVVIAASFTAGQTINIGVSEGTSASTTFKYSTAYTIQANCTGLVISMTRPSTTIIDYLINEIRPTYPVA